MKTLELTTTEMETLRDVLRRYLGELELEIRHTDTRDFKAMLRGREQQLESILRKLSGNPVLV
jgi:hypothetical protein